VTLYFARRRLATRRLFMRRSMNSLISAHNGIRFKRGWR